MIWRLASCVLGGWLIVRISQSAGEVYTSILHALRGLP